MDVNLLDRICTVICEVLQSKIELTEDTQLWTVGINSIGIVHVMARCEEEFEIDFDPEDLTVAKLNTPGSIARLLQEKYINRVLS